MVFIDENVNLPQGNHVIYKHMTDIIKQSNIILKIIAIFISGISWKMVKTVKLGTDDNYEVHITSPPGTTSRKAASLA